MVVREMTVQVGPVTATMSVSWEDNDLRTFEAYVVKLEGPEGEIDDLLTREVKDRIEEKVIARLPELAMEVAG